MHLIISPFFSILFQSFLPIIYLIGGFLFIILEKKKEKEEEEEEEEEEDLLEFSLHSFSLTHIKSHAFIFSTFTHFYNFITFLYL